MDRGYGEFGPFEPYEFGFSHPPRRNPIGAFGADWDVAGGVGGALGEDA